MDSLSAINTNLLLAGIPAPGTITPADALLTSALIGPLGLGGSSLTFAGISETGQLLSAVSAFQDTLQALRPGTATSGGGQNFSTDFASLAAETQNFVDAFNAAQKAIANVNTGNGLQTGGSSTASNLAQAFNTQVQANFSNGNSPLTALSQLGIEFQPALLPGQSSTLSINLSTLQSAFNTNAAGAFSLLEKAGSALGSLANSFINQYGQQYSSLAALTQSPLGATLLANGLSPQAQAANAVFGLLSSQSLSGGISLQQALTALNEYTTVSSLLA